MDSGLAPAIVKKSQAMRSIVLKALLAALCVLLTCPSLASDIPPKILWEPLLGLQFDRDLIRFERLPPQVFASCPTLADRESIKSHWYVFAMTTRGNGEIYYLVGGYSVRTHPNPPEIPKYQLDDAGVIFRINRGRCSVYEEAARNMFAPNMADEIPASILQALAHDHLQRLMRAFAGSSRLREALRKQRIAMDKLPPALRETYSAILK